MTRWNDSRNVGASRNLLSTRIPSGITRRGFLAGAGSLLLLGAAGCGGGSGSGEQSSGGSGDTRTIEHKFGSTEVAGMPERVVSVGYSDQDPILALGVIPVAVRY